MSNREFKDFVDQTRKDLGATLDEVEHRLSPPYVAKQVFSSVSRSFDRNPAAWLIGIGIAAVAAVAAVLWAVFGDD